MHACIHVFIHSFIDSFIHSRLRTLRLTAVCITADYILGRPPAAAALGTQTAHPVSGGAGGGGRLGARGLQVVGRRTHQTARRFSVGSVQRAVELLSAGRLRMLMLLQLSQQTCRPAARSVTLTSPKYSARDSATDCNVRAELRCETVGCLHPNAVWGPDP